MSDTKAVEAGESLHLIQPMQIKWLYRDRDLTRHELNCECLKNQCVMYKNSSISSNVHSGVSSPYNAAVDTSDIMI